MGVPMCCRRCFKCEGFCQIFRQKSSTSSSSSMLSIQVKFLCLAAVLGYCLSFHNRSLYALAILPGEVLPPNNWIWPIATHNLLELHWWAVFCDIIVILLYGKLLQPLWGSREMLIFYIVVNLFTAILTTFSYFIIFCLTQNSNYIFDRYVHGQAGYVAAFFVALKQIMPDHVVAKTWSVELRCRDIPSVLLCAGLVLWMTNATTELVLLMTLWGLIVSWIYLRFYQRHPNGSYGDNTDSFTFASFFPSPIRPLIQPVSNAVYIVLSFIHVCRSSSGDVSPDSSKTITVTLHGACDGALDADRLRCKAVRGADRREDTTASVHWFGGQSERVTQKLDRLKLDASSGDDDSFVLVKVDDFNVSTSAGDK